MATVTMRFGCAVDAVDVDAAVASSLAAPSAVALLRECQLCLCLRQQAAARGCAMHVGRPFSSARRSKRLLSFRPYWAVRLRRRISSKRAFLSPRSTGEMAEMVVPLLLKIRLTMPCALRMTRKV